jgi:hypothetical protein
MSDSILEALDKILDARKNASSDDSYVANLHDQGLNKILEKVGEESIETLLAAKDAVTIPTLFMKQQIFGFTLWLCCPILAKMPTACSMS